MTTAAAAAALPPEPEPEARPERLIWVDVESAPAMTEVRSHAGDVVGMFPEHDPGLGLTDQMAEKLRWVCDHIDGRTCEGNGCFSGPEAPGGDPTPGLIGFVLAGEADERTEWRWCALVQHGKRVIAVCEDCSPTTIYDTLFINPEE